jgi:hypothetical protein
MLSVGKFWLLAALTLSALVALSSGRLGWTNYWGGMVFAPAVLLIVVLAILAERKRRRQVVQGRRRRK